MFSKIKVLSGKISRTHVALVGVVVCLIGIGIYSSFVPVTGSKDVLHVEDIVAQMGKNDTTVFEDIRTSLSDIIKKWGVQGAIDVNKYAFVNNKIGIYQCHVITHLIGHEAVIFYGNDYEAVVGHDTHFCELGYRHGAEAQVALNGGNYKEELYAMCDAIHRKNPDAECFHGAGHAFMNESLDVNESLALCDGLINEQHDVQDVTPCYNAVFAELTNLIGGTDGGTGIQYTGGAPLTMEEKTPLEYCAKFDDRYKLQCVFEFSGLGISEVSTPADIEAKLIGCSSEGYAEEMEGACIRSVSAVGAQHELALSHTITVPQHILGLSDFLRKSYIIGAGTEMKQYFNSGATRDWQSFCGVFTVEQDIMFCEGLFTTQG